MRKLIDLLVALMVVGSLWAVSTLPAPAQAPVVPGSSAPPAAGGLPAFTPFGGTNPFAVTGNTNLASYSAAVAAFGNSSAGDIFCVNGSATKTIKVKNIQVSAVASAAIADDIQLYKRSTADTGGTPTSVTAVPHDSLNAAATASVTAYATAPTAGTLVGMIRSRVITIPTTSAGVESMAAIFHFTTSWDQPITLRGATQGLCVAVPATAGGLWALDAEWSEE